MEPTTALAIGLLAVAGTALIAMVLAWRGGAVRGRALRGAPDDTRVVDPDLAQGPFGPARLRPTRIVVVGDPRPLPRLRGAGASGLVGSPVDPRRRLLRDTSAALLVVALVALVATNLPGGPDQAGGVLSATATPAAGSAAPPGAAGSPRAAGSPGSTSPSSAASGRPATAASPRVGASPGPGATASGHSSQPVPNVPSASRLALLQSCPGRPDCYLYVIRTGDTLLRISSFFGIRADVILRLNPGITDPSIVVRGSTIVLPTPTR